MTEIEFKELYKQEYTSFIKSFFPKLELTRDKYPEQLEEQIKFYESKIINEADNYILKTIKKHNINLSSIFGEGYTYKFMLNEITLKCWSIQKEIRESVFDYFIIRGLH